MIVKEMIFIKMADQFFHTLFELRKPLWIGSSYAPHVFLSFEVSYTQRSSAKMLKSRSCYLCYLCSNQALQQTDELHGLSMEVIAKTLW